MRGIRKLKGKVVQHPDFGQCIVTSIPKGAKTRVEIEVIQRGPGWDDITETYKPYKEVYLNPDECPGARSISWRLTHRDEYGHKEIVHVNSLSL